MSEGQEKKGRATVPKLNLAGGLHSASNKTQSTIAAKVSASNEDTQSTTSKVSTEEGKSKPSKIDRKAPWTVEERHAYITKKFGDMPASQLRFLEEALKEASLPLPWVPTRSKDGRFFFYNPEEKKSDWNHPRCTDEILKDLFSICRRSLQLGSAEERYGFVSETYQSYMKMAEEQLSKWQPADDGSGNTYYYHSETMESTWDNPGEALLEEWRVRLDPIRKLTEEDYVAVLLEEDTRNDNAQDETASQEQTAQQLSPLADRVKEARHKERKDAKDSSTKVDVAQTTTHEVLATATSKDSAVGHIVETAGEFSSSSAAEVLALRQRLTLQEEALQEQAFHAAWEKSQVLRELQTATEAAEEHKMQSSQEQTMLQWELKEAHAAAEKSRHQEEQLQSSLLDKISAAEMQEACAAAEKSRHQEEQLQSSLLQKISAAEMQEARAAAEKFRHQEEQLESALHEKIAAAEAEKKTDIEAAMSELNTSQGDLAKTSDEVIALKAEIQLLQGEVHEAQFEAETALNAQRRPDPPSVVDTDSQNMKEKIQEMCELRETLQRLQAESDANTAASLEKIRALEAEKKTNVESAMSEFNTSQGDLAKTSDEVITLKAVIQQLQGEVHEAQFEAETALNAQRRHDPPSVRTYFSDEHDSAALLEKIKALEAEKKRDDETCMSALDEVSALKAEMQQLQGEAHEAQFEAETAIGELNTSQGHLAKTSDQVLALKAEMQQLHDEEAREKEEQLQRAAEELAAERARADQRIEKLFTELGASNTDASREEMEAEIRKRVKAEIEKKARSLEEVEAEKARLEEAMLVKKGLLADKLGQDIAMKAEMRQLQDEVQQERLRAEEALNASEALQLSHSAVSESFQQPDPETSLPNATRNAFAQMESKLLDTIDNFASPKVLQELHQQQQLNTEMQKEMQEELREMSASCRQAVQVAECTANEAMEQARQAVITPEQSIIERAANQEQTTRREEIAFERAAEIAAQIAAERSSNQEIVAMQEEIADARARETKITAQLQAMQAENFASQLAAKQEFASHQEQIAVERTDELESKIAAERAATLEAREFATRQEQIAVERAVEIATKIATERTATQESLAVERAAEVASSIAAQEVTAESTAVLEEHQELLQQKVASELNEAMHLQARSQRELTSEVNQAMNSHTKSLQDVSKLVSRFDGFERREAAKAQDQVALAYAFLKQVAETFSPLAEHVKEIERRQLTSQEVAKARDIETQRKLESELQSLCALEKQSQEVQTRTEAAMQQQIDKAMDVFRAQFEEIAQSRKEDAEQKRQMDIERDLKKQTEKDQGHLIENERHHTKLRLQEAEDRQRKDLDQISKLGEELMKTSQEAKRRELEWKSEKRELECQVQFREIELKAELKQREWQLDFQKAQGLESRGDRPRKSSRVRNSLYDALASARDCDEHDTDSSAPTGRRKRRPKSAGAIQSARAKDGWEELEDAFDRLVDKAIPTTVARGLGVFDEKVKPQKAGRRTRPESTVPSSRSLVDDIAADLDLQLGSCRASRGASVKKKKDKAPKQSLTKSQSQPSRSVSYAQIAKMVNKQVGHQEPDDELVAPTVMTLDEVYRSYPEVAQILSVASN